jgi:hypothetical protein
MLSWPVSKIQRLIDPLAVLAEAAAADIKRIVRPIRQGIVDRLRDPPRRPAGTVGPVRLDQAGPGGLGIEPP